MSAENELGRPAPKSRLGLLAVIGVVAIAVALGYVGYIKGVFKAHEKVAIVTWNEDSFWDPTAQGAADAAKEFGVDVTFVRSKPDPIAQNQHIKDLLAAGNVALAISPNNAAAQEAVINSAAEQAVVLTFDTDAPNTRRRGFVGTDDYAAGQMAAQQVRSVLPEGGKVIITVGSIDMSNGRDRRQGLIDDLLDRPYRPDNAVDALDASLKGQTYSVAATLTDGGDPDKAAQLLADALKANPDVKCVVGLFSYNGGAILKALDTAGKKDQVKIVAFDDAPEVQAAVQSGAVYSSVIQSQYRCGYETVRVMADILRGAQETGPVGPRITTLPITVLRPMNIDALRDTRAIRRPAK